MAADQDRRSTTVSRSSAAWEVMRSVPFTTTVVAIMLLLAVVTGSLWNPLRDRPLLDAVAYGLPALQAGRWWTPVSGAFFALIPLQYVPIAGGAALMLGWSEWRVGTRKVATAAISSHLFAVLGAAALLAVLAPTGWGWAERVAAVTDVGFSTGALGAVAAASVSLAPPWRGRLRSALVLYAVIAFLYVGLLWDLEHLLAIGFGLVLGPVLVGRRPRLRRTRLSRHEWRVVAFTLFAVSGLINVTLYLAQTNGPLGATSPDTDAFSVLISAAISLLLANGLRRGSRRVWHLAGALTTLALLVGVAALVVEVTGLDVSDSSGEVTSSVPEIVVSLLLSLLQLGVLVVGRSAFRARLGRRARRGSTVDLNDRETAVGLLQTHGGGTMSWMGTWDENRWFIHRDASGQPVGYQAFQSHRGVAIGLADPVAADDAGRADVLAAFVEDRESNGEAVCFFSVTDEVAQWGRRTGKRDVLVAEEAILDLASLEFKGKQWQSVRTALNRAAKEGIEYREGRLADMPRGVVTQVRAISEMWVGDKDLPEMGFTLGSVDEALDPEVVVGLAVDGDGTVHGVTSWLPVYAADGKVRGWTLDVMRRLPDGFRPVTEFLIASAALSFKAAGAELVSLSGAPLAHVGTGTEAQEPLDRLLGALGEALEPLYGFRSLESFKQKFSPRNEPVYLVFDDEAALPRIGLALTAAYLPDASLRDLARSGLRARSASRTAA